jgi:hypothetical protein
MRITKRATVQRIKQCIELAYIFLKETRRYAPFAAK